MTDTEIELTIAYQKLAKQYYEASRKTLEPYGYGDWEFLHKTAEKQYKRARQLMGIE